VKEGSKRLGGTMDNGPSRLMKNPIHDFSNMNWSHTCRCVQNVVAFVIPHHHSYDVGDIVYPYLHGHRHEVFTMRFNFNVGRPSFLRKR
jgi:hypothetical protein